MAVAWAAAVKVVEATVVTMAAERAAVVRAVAAAGARQVAVTEEVVAAAAGTRVGVAQWAATEAETRCSSRYTRRARRPMRRTESWCSQAAVGYKSCDTPLHMQHAIERIRILLTPGRVTYAE